MMAPRRPLGALETEVLEVLWACDDALTPAEVLERLDTELAYTTVMTILTRLWQKGLVERRKSGRAFAYSAVDSEAGVFAERMHRELESSGDRFATMSRFLDSLDRRQQAELRRLLEERDR